MSKDLSINGPYSPVSLKKFMEVHTPTKEGVTVLIDGTGQGIAFDDPETLVMTPDDRIYQAKWYRENLFKKDVIPAYLFRYLDFMFVSGDKKKYPTDASVMDALRAGTLTAESVEYKQISNLITYSEHNKEAAQIIGLSQLLAGTLNQAKKAGVKIRMLIQEPEVNLHPKREARIMSLFYMIQEEWGDKPIVND